MPGAMPALFAGMSYTGKQQQKRKKKRISNIEH
jgi:hypothetical protein